jgi:hypothetical protein
MHRFYGIIEHASWRFLSIIKNDSKLFTLWLVIPPTGPPPMMPPRMPPGMMPPGMMPPGMIPPGMIPPGMPPMPMGNYKFYFWTKT